MFHFINVVFIAIIGIILLLGFVSIFIDKGKIGWIRRLAETASGLMTSVGVTGTFLGIFLGLKKFDVTQIDASVPLLLEGMKLAFLTSVVGLIASIFFRIVKNFAPAQEVDTKSNEDPIALLQLIVKNTADQTRALVGDEDASLLTQIKNTRIDMNDRFKDQISAFKDFAETMAENNTNALIEALEGVIRDFNEKLSEQFGENFKQLNHGVGKLVDWQENYKDHVEQMELKISEAVTAVEASKNALMQIEESTERIPEHALALKSVVEEAGTAIKVTGGLLVGIETLAGKVGTAYPQIEQNIVDLTSNLERSASEQKKSLSEASDSMTDGLRKSMETMQAGLNSNFEIFDNQMQNEMQRALQNLGDQLGSISHKLSTDYNAFADAAQRIIRISGRDS